MKHVSSIFVVETFLLMKLE